MKWALLVVCLVALNGCDHRVLQPTLALPAPGSPVPAFALALRDSGELRSSELSGHPTILFLVLQVFPGKAARILRKK